MKSVLEFCLVAFVIACLIGVIIQIVWFILQVIFWIISGAIVFALALVLLACIGKSLHFFYVRHSQKTK